MPLQRTDSLLEILCYEGNGWINASDGYVEDGGWYVGMYGMYMGVCMLNRQPIWLRTSMYECVYSRDV